MRESGDAQRRDRRVTGGQTDSGKRHRGGCPGRLFVVSLGPGSADHLTPAAKQALDDSDVVVGYRTYVDLVRPLLSEQEVVATGMRQELDRVYLALDRALGGDNVSLVSSGDAGIYGMAGLVLEVCRAKSISLSPELGGLQITFVPGVPAFAAAGSLLGAPLMHDFAAISLSDLLTPWEIIEKRVRLAAEGDFVINLYNPKSKRRHWQIGKVREIILESRNGTTPVGIVSKATREGQQVTLTDLDNMLSYPIDMQTVIIVGNSRTFRHGTFLVTPRGYLDKYDVEESQNS
ncbi:MAG: precorrin-3B C(17)-methyltransferase [Deltaproteobacteria bacterium]|nr:MAG: precorrin-3B C(17)-methyltransferase [Deltaproteobacteria bacterium]